MRTRKMNYTAPRAQEQKHHDHHRNGNAARLILQVGELPPQIVEPAMLDAMLLAEIVKRIEETSGHVVFDIGDLPNWPDENRYALLQLVNQVGGRGAVPAQRRRGDGQLR